MLNSSISSPASPIIIPIILSGGSGSRLWPLSRKTYPKQFLKLITGHSLLQETILRIPQLPSITPPLIMCNENQYFITIEQTHDLGISPSHVILEPVGKNTAPAVAIAALFARQHYQNNPLLLVMPADQVIEKINLFHDAIEAGLSLANDHLISFGITPTSPQTGYGYIKKGDQLADRVWEIAAFTEKPCLEKAQSYIASQDYYWNSGIFLFSATTYLQELEELAPTMFHACQRAFDDAIWDANNYLRLTFETFNQCPADSIDYAVMEKTKKAAVIPFNPGWSDVGDWASIAKAHEANANEQGNVIKGHVIMEDVSNSYLYSEGRLIAAVGIKDQVIIETKDAVLVAHKDRAQDVKLIVQQLQSKSHQVAESHHRIYHAWGFEEILSQGMFYLVKHLTIKPNAILPPQIHQYFTKYWIVVENSAEATVNNNVIILKENTTTFVPFAAKHFIANHTKQLLHVIEIQSGDPLQNQELTDACEPDKIFDYSNSTNLAI